VHPDSWHEPPRPPANLTAAPRDARKTKSGLAYRVLRKGTGAEHPTAEDRVSVNYSAWTTDSTLVDSTVAKGQPVTVPVNRVIPGWSEGLQLMVAGEKTLF
jgi:FKBP-type peptidyl-prolyl cis-trans isomerase